MALPLPAQPEPSASPSSSDPDVPQRAVASGGEGRAKGSGSFGVRELVEQTLDDFPGDAPGAVARRVCELIRDEDLRPALQDVLYHEVRRVLNTRRSRSGGPSHGTPAPLGQLDQPIAFARGQWRPLRDCTVGNLDGVLTFRERITAEQEALNASLRRVRAAMVAARVRRVGDLDPDVFVACWAGGPRG